MLSEVPVGITSICSKWSDDLSGIMEDSACADYVRSELPDLLRNKGLFAQILGNLLEGGAYPDLRRSTMFDNELILFTDPSGHFSLRLFLWGSGEYTVVHDHNSWGVIGPVSGVLEVINYRREDDGSQEGYARLEETGRLRCLHGDTAYTLPLNKGIHKIGNPTQDTMASLAMYGKPLPRSYINGFDIESNHVYKILPPKVKKNSLRSRPYPVCGKSL